MSAPRHRAPGQPVTRGWSRWPKHRDNRHGPAESDGLNEFAAQWVAAMKLRERQLHHRRMAGSN
jgi:hypothetical protein